jgi:hypothetical protein
MPRRLALGADRVYWTNASDGSVMTVAKTGGETTVVARGQAEPWGIAADAAGVYWVNHADGTVRRALRR